MPVIGFIGTGNMGGALARAAAKQEANRVLLTNRTQAKAEALAAASGAALGEVLHIDYARGEPDMELRPMAKMALARGGVESQASYDMNIAPEDVTVSDTVTLLWRLTD